MTFSSFGYLVLLLDILFISSQLEKYSLIVYFGLFLILTYFINRRILYILMKWKIWLSLILVFILSAIFLGTKDIKLFDISMSSLGLLEGVNLTIRTLILLMGMQLFTKRIKIEELSSLFTKFNMSGLGFSIGIGLNMVGLITNCVETTFYSAIQKGCFRRKIFKNIKVIFLNIIFNIITIAENINQTVQIKGYHEKVFSTGQFHLTLLDKLSVILSILLITTFLLFNIR